MSAPLSSPAKCAVLYEGVGIKSDCRNKKGKKSKATMGESKSRGELAEIRTTLASLASTSGSSKGESAVTAKRDVFKKIINYITIGIDMSSLFMQVDCLFLCLYLHICTGRLFVLSLPSECFFLRWAHSNIWRN